MDHILLADTSHPKAYDFDNLARHAMGGTESSALRTAAIWTRHGHPVTFFQQHRNSPTKQHGINFIGPAQLATINAPDHVVILRKFPQLLVFQQHFPKARLHLWIHTYKNWEYALKRGFRLKQPWQLITNSNTHAADCDRILHQGFWGRIFNLFKPKVPVHTCYNPIPVFEQQPVDRDRNKLLFYSAPNKGLKQVLKTFQRINEHLPDLKLCVANPGYREDHKETIKNVTYLGPLPQNEIKRHLAESLCVFYPQDSFAETFGLIYAEANGHGTPVLAHDIGSAREILHPNNPLVNANDWAHIVETLRLWQLHPPEVSHRNEFDDEAVYQQWSKALDINKSL